MASLRSAAAALRPALTGGERRLMATAAAAPATGAARWEPMGAREYYDYRRAIYGGITHKAILVDAAGTLLAPTEPMAQVGSRIASPNPRPRFNIPFYFDLCCERPIAAALQVSPRVRALRFHWA
jgi:hypothetical protein